MGCAKTSRGLGFFFGRGGPFLCLPIPLFTKRRLQPPSRSPLGVSRTPPCRGSACTGGSLGWGSPPSRPSPHPPRLFLVFPPFPHPSGSARLPAQDLMPRPLGGAGGQRWGPARCHRCGRDTSPASSGRTLGAACCKIRARPRLGGSTGGVTTGAWRCHPAGSPPAIPTPETPRGCPHSRVARGDIAGGLEKKKTFPLSPHPAAMQRSSRAARTPALIGGDAFWEAAVVIFRP